jgi:hypothetical protein
MKTVTVMPNQLVKDSCTEVQFQTLPDGTIEITTFDGHEPRVKYIYKPVTVVVSDQSSSDRVVAVR